MTTIGYINRETGETRVPNAILKKMGLESGGGVCFFMTDGIAIMLTDSQAIELMAGKISIEVHRS